MKTEEWVLNPKLTIDIAELRGTILQCLEDNSGICLDNKYERFQLLCHLLKAVVPLSTTKVNNTKVNTAEEKPIKEKPSWESFFNGMYDPEEIGLKGEQLELDLEDAETGHVCNTHPDAPHGFDRGSSHAMDRYVCYCEGWRPEDE